MSNNIEHLIREPVPAANETTPMSLLDIGGTLPMTLARQNVVIYFGGTIVVQTNPTAMSIDAAQVKVSLINSLNFIFFKIF